MRWSGRQAVVVLPEEFDLTAVGPVREQLLTVINRGAAVVVVDMTATLSCDYAGADALARVYRRAVANGTELRLVIAAPVVRRVIAVSGLDRLVPVFPTLEAAQAVQPSAVVLALPARAASTGSAALAPPGGLGLVGRLPVGSPASSAGLGRAAQQGRQQHEFEEALTRIAGGIFHAGLTLQTALDQPPGALRRAAERALELLDGTVRDAWTGAFAWHGYRPHGLADAGESGAAVQPGGEAGSGALRAVGEDIVRLSRRRASEATQIRARSRQARAQSAKVLARTRQAAAVSAATQIRASASVGPFALPDRQRQQASSLYGWHG